MKFSYSAVWDRTVRTLKANSSLLIPVAGAFLFLPAIAAAYLAPPPAAETMAAMVAHVRENWLLFLAVNIIGFVGNLAILILALDENRPTVGAAIRTALVLLPVYFLVAFMSGLMIGIGLLLLILPGLYLVGRLAMAGPVIVAEHRKNPFDVIKRSFAVTKGNGWAVIGLILLLFVAFYVISLAITFIFGVVLLLIDRASGGGIGAFLLLIITTAVGAGFNVVLMVMIASVYRSLAAPESSVPVSH